MEECDRSTIKNGETLRFRWRKPKVQRLSLNLDTANAATGVYSDLSLTAPNLSDTYIGSLPSPP